MIYVKSLSAHAHKYAHDPSYIGQWSLAHIFKNLSKVMHSRDNCSEVKEVAVTRPLETVEILEIILLHLPIKDLLHAQEISRFFHGVVHGSSLIQRALFFEPVARAMHEQSDLAVRQRDAIRQRLLPEGPGVPAAVPKKVAVNPFLRNYLFHKHFSYPSTAVTPRDLPRNGAAPLDHNNETASWRRMLVFQPHANPLFITREHRPDMERNLKNGLTMDETYKIRREDKEYPRALPYPLWFELRGVEWDWSLCTLTCDGENVHHAANGSVMQISGWENLTRMQAIMSVQ